MRLIQTALVSASLYGCTVVNSPLRAATIVDERALADEQSGADWLSTGRTYSERRYSPLAQINDGNVDTLGLAWFLDLKGERTLEATPLAVDGVLYFSGAFGRTFAVDARNRRQLWKFDPESGNYRPEIFRFSGSLGGHRGVAYWQGKIYVAAIDGRLFALDAKNGKVVWVVQTLDDPKVTRRFPGRLASFRDMAIIGQRVNLGSRGYVTAYDARTGVQRWRFYTVPGDPTLGFENEAMAARPRRHGLASGGNPAVTHPCGMASPTTRNSVAFILALLTGFRSRAPAPGCPREIICSCPRSSRWMRIQGSIFGTIRKLRGATSITTRTCRWCSRISSLPEPRARCYCTPPRMDSSTSSTEPRAN